MADSILVRRIKIYTGTIVIGALVGLGLRLLIVGTQPASEFLTSGYTAHAIFFVIGASGTLTAIGWYSKHLRGIKVFLGILLMTAATMWVVPFPA